MPGMVPGKVFIGSDASDPDTWLPVGALFESVAHEPADTTPLNLTAFGTLTAEFKGEGTVGDHSA